LKIEVAGPKVTSAIWGPLDEMIITGHENGELIQWDPKVDEHDCKQTFLCVIARQIFNIFLHFNDFHSTTLKKKLMHIHHQTETQDDIYPARYGTNYDFVTLLF